MIGQYRHHSQGYIALMAVLIVGAASLAIGLALLVAGADSQRSTLVSQQATQARSLASACAEEGLQQINDDVAFTGSGSMTMGAGTCTYTVTNAGGTDRIIETTGTVNTVVKKLIIYATISTSSLTITSWQEVS